MSMVDYQAMLLDPIYEVLGVDATVTLEDGVTSFEGLTVIDKTSGVQLGDQGTKVDSIEPACCIRYAEWKDRGRTPDDFEGATIAFNGSSWKIVGFPKRPVPSGARAGEILLILSSETVLPESDDSSDSESDSSS